MCKYCEGNFEQIIDGCYDMNFIKLKDGKYYLCLCGTEYEETEINFCPMCGRKLKEDE